MLFFHLPQGHLAQPAAVQPHHPLLYTVHHIIFILSPEPNMLHQTSCRRGIWRNGLLFSPIIQYGTYTYKQIMLDPLAKALAGALRTVAAEGTLWPMPNLERPRVYVALQGELL